MSPIHKAVENGESLDANLVSAWFSVGALFNQQPTEFLQLLQNFKEMVGAFNSFLHAVICY